MSVQAKTNEALFNFIVLTVGSTVGGLVNVPLKYLLKGSEYQKHPCLSFSQGFIVSMVGLGALKELGQLSNYLQIPPSGLNFFAAAFIGGVFGNHIDPHFSIFVDGSILLFSSVLTIHYIATPLLYSLPIN